MERTLETSNGRSYRFVEIRSLPLPDDLFVRERHACLVSLAEPELAGPLKEPFAQALVNSGCRWFTCHGAGSAAWEDSVDWANIGVTSELPPESDFVVITTSHENEPLCDAANLFAFAADDSGPFLSNLVVLIGSSPGLERTICEAIEGEAGSGAA